jgi:hypothetical protein
MNDSSKMGSNDHMSGTVFRYEGNDEVAVSVSFGSSDVPFDPFKIPAPASVNRASDDGGNTISITPTEKFERAELQIFSGGTLNTSTEASRRAFIDFERDADGKPIRDEGGKLALKPVDPEQAETLLGRKPAILLSGSTEWQEGKNTGSLGVDVDGKEIPGGQFKPTGTIEKYTPDPSIIVGS